MFHVVFSGCGKPQISGTTETESADMGNSCIDLQKDFKREKLLLCYKTEHLWYRLARELFNAGRQIFREVTETD